MKSSSITFILIYCMPFGLFAQDSPLSKGLKSWIKNPGSELSNHLKKVQEPEVKTEAECGLICQALETVKSQMQTSFDEKLEDNIFELTGLFQKASTKEVAQCLNDKGIPLLTDILSLKKSKQYETKSISDCETMILKMFALYKNPAGLNRLSEYVNSDFKNEDFLWSVILNIISKKEEKYNLIIKGLKGKIPTGFLGISYLDMCNAIAIETSTFKHPFNSAGGFAFLEKTVNNSGPENESYIISVTTSIPFLSKEYQEKLFDLVSSHKNAEVRIEAAWAGAKIGNDKAIGKLVDFSKDYRYSSKAVDYLKELNLEAKVPGETQHPDFKALSEMCSWLSHPNEFGSYPDHAEVFYKKSLYWPPTKDVRTIYLVKYLYKNHKDDGSDQQGIGLVGSVTFSLFGPDDMLTLKPIEVLALHCNWELEKKNYKDIKSGVALLKKHNKDLE